ncbi:MAG: T9SS type A sorting domain-containing protein, partial [Candidatus Eisenbacteria bacterium]|nr:T9SS type A sorting domain-containing protein [Candidatus Eisenbacteria bacterium]
AMEYAYMAVSIENFSYNDQDYAFDAETYQGATGVAEGPQRIVVMAQSSPNPFYPTTTLRYSLSQASPVEVRIMDPAGRTVRTLVSGQQPAGMHEAQWDGNDAGGLPVRPGTYFYQVRTGDESRTGKMILLD